MKAPSNAPKSRPQNAAIAPLSHGQRALWFIQKLAPNSSAYNGPFAARIRSRVDVDCLRRAVAFVIARHAILRTTFTDLNGEPVQVVHATMPVPLTLENLGDVDEVAMVAALNAERHRPLDLENGPAWRIALLSRAADDHTLILTAHHILVDLFGCCILVRDLLTAYSAFVSGQEPELPALTGTYHDYVAWQEELLANQGEDSARFWREHLAGGVPVLDMPLDRPRPAVQTFDGAAHPFHLPVGTAARIRAFAKAHRSSPLMTLIAMYQVLLHRYSGQEDFAIGTPVPGRRGHQAFADMVGSFMNMLPVRANLSGRPTFVELLSRVTETVWNAREHQEYPFPLIVKDLSAARVSSYSPVFQTLFSLQRPPAELEALASFCANMGAPVSTRIGELEIESVGLSNQEGQLDLSMEITEFGGEYYGELKYNTALFARETIAAMADAFCTLVCAVLEDPSQHIDALPLLHEEERARALHQAAGKTPEPAAGRSFPALFDAQVARTPNAIAVRCGTEALTYQELQRRASGVAAGLRERGIGANQVVALYFERGLELVVAMVGVLKAGGAYVALDPAYPAARTRQLLAQSGAAGVIASADGRAHLFHCLASLGDSRPWLCSLGELGQDQDPALASFAPEPAPSDLAYIIFTSGSTGVPKGAMVEHRGMVNHLFAKISDLGLRAGDVIAQNAPQSFVIANWQLLAGLLVGAEIAIIGSEDARDPQALVARIADHGITVLQIVPSLLRVVVEYLEGERERRAAGPARLDSLRWVVPTGEALPPVLSRRWLRLYPSIPLLNAYGASECSDDVAHHLIDRAPEADALRTPIGKPVPGAALYILEHSRALVPAGMPGDLWVGGVQVGRGYLGDAERTDAAFVADPFAPGSRMYRTGDRARWRRNGTIEYLGRSDYQVKVSGVRIELGEVEAALRAHPAVKDAAVIAASDASGDTRLIAHVAGDESAGADALRSHLQERLPAAMIPALFVRHDALPLNQNGKLDRRALSAYVIDEQPEAAEAQAPTDPVEAELVAIWSELLGVPLIGIHDNFFKLGGHSLLAVRLAVKVRECFGIELPLSAIFDLSTIARLAALIHAEQASGAAATSSEVLAITPDAARLHEPFALTDLQQAYWLGQSGLDQSTNLPAVAYVEHEVLDLDLPRFEHAWQEVIARHPMLRAIVRGDGLQQVLAEVPPYVVEIRDLRGLGTEAANARIEVVREELASTGLTADSWPTVKLLIHRVDDRRSLVHMGFPLILGDLQSFRIINRDLEALYRDPNAELPAIEVSYRDYVEALRNLRLSAAHRKAKDYWRERLPSLPSGPGLPTVSRPQTGEKPRFVRSRGVLPTAAWKALKERARRSGLTPTAVVAAAYAEALSAFSHTPHFALNMLYQNRPALHSQIQEVVGNFSTTILLEVDHRAGESFASRASKLQSQLFRDIDHAQVSGIEVVRELARERGGNMAVAMPVVLASTLHLSAEEMEDERILGTPVTRRLQTPHVWIDHQVNESHAGLSYHWDVLDGLFLPGVIAAMFETYETLLADLAEGRGWEAVSPIRLPASELYARTQANATAAPVSTALLHDLVAERARELPDTPAVIAVDRTLTYAELQRRVNYLAGHLRAMGIKPNQLVAIVMEKGWEQVVAALAIMAAGGAYLPVDPSLPGERLRYLISHSSAALILTQPALMNAMEWPDQPRIAVDGRADRQSAQRLESVQAPTDLAYVIFTSGSTGLPKGVMIDHRGAVNTVLDINRRFDIGRGDRVLAVSSLSFDLSVYDIFGILAAGGTMVVPAHQQNSDPSHWAALVRRHQVTVWNSVPQLMQLLADREEQTGAAELADLRVVMMSGDWIPVTLPDRIRRLAPGARMYSLGGATEASIWSIYYPIDQVDPAWQSIPYGRPLTNQTFHVLDHGLKPCPVWGTGELYIGGIGLALGYLGDEEKTKYRFITHPDTGERLYRTGDLGRYLPSGDIEFLGRADFQVKVQGFRIELGEIEAQLEKHPQVSVCVVTAQGPKQGEKRLVAYLVGTAGEVPGDALRAYLSAKLPAYMVPAVFINLRELPLTSNGKVDRQALPSVEQALSAGRTRRAELPRTLAEQSLAAIWREVLEIETIGIHEQFFADLGGHSFAAVRLLARIQSTFGQELSLADLLRQPTIAELAAELETRSGKTAWSPLLPLRITGSKKPLFLVHPVGGSALCYRTLLEHMDADRPVYGLQSRGLTSQDAPYASIEEMAAAYVSAVREVQPHGPYYLGGWSMGGLVAFAMAHALEAAGQEVALLTLMDSAVPGYLSNLDGIALLDWFLADLTGLAGTHAPVHALAHELAAIPEPAQLGYAFDHLKAAGAIAPGITLEQVERLFRVFLANNAAMERYQASALPIPALVINAAEKSIEIDRARAWQQWVSVEAVHEVDGDHYTMLTGVGAADLAVRIERALFRAGRRGGIKPTPRMAGHATRSI